jgi:hypothetical protein
MIPNEEIALVKDFARRVRTGEVYDWPAHQFQRALLSMLDTLVSALRTQQSQAATIATLKGQLAEADALLADQGRVVRKGIEALQRAGIGSTARN